MNGRAVLAFVCSAMVLCADAAAGQARIEAVIPENSRVAVQQLGATGAAAAAVAMELLPGDIITYPRDSVFVELSCTSGGRTNVYRLTSPFRVLIDVPSDSACHVNILAGRTDVVAEAPSQTSAGGVMLGSSGTEYSVEVTRTREGTVLTCTVFDGVVRAIRGRTAMTGGRGNTVASATAGSKLLWRPEQTVVRLRNTPSEIDRAATTHARFDVAAARRIDPAVNADAAFAQLKALHVRVLSNPTDTAGRVELAKRQLLYRIDDRAAYNLQRADINTEAKARRYQIDPAVVRRATVGRMRIDTLSTALRREPPPE
jgi:hypothetical protein